MGINIVGLSIHYSGRFKNDASLLEMIEEVKDVAEVYDWDYFIFDEQFPNEISVDESFDGNIYGISFTPDNCETISLTFLSNRRMSGPVQLKFFGNSNDKTERDFLYMLSVKTQFAGIETHKLIIHFLRYLNNKYFDNFELIDEGKYWETGDGELLQSIFTKYTELLDNFSSAIENYPKNEDETFENYFERLMKKIRNRKRNNY